MLDDNKLLTLPNGERLIIPSNVRLIFEVESLRYATPATVSRCGMVWFSAGLITDTMLCAQHLKDLEGSELSSSTGTDGADLIELNDEASTAELRALQSRMLEAIHPMFEGDGLVLRALATAKSLPHIMDFSSIRVLSTLFSLLRVTIRSVLEHSSAHPDFSLSDDVLQCIMSRRMLIDLIWSFAGDSPQYARAAFGVSLQEWSDVDPPKGYIDQHLPDYDIDLALGSWTPWQDRVPSVEVETHAIMSTDNVIPTMDTLRHEALLYGWLREQKSLILCGPPGSGKTMTLLSALRRLPGYDVVALNFSSATTTDLILNALEQHCEYRKTPNGLTLSPSQAGRRVVLFCDEINLPTLDKYGTQKVISLLRQMIAMNGFWRPTDLSWITLSRIQFVGACNPPTDPGRIPLTHRFLRHAAVIMVDNPGGLSLKQIYGTFNRALLKVIPNLRGLWEPLTNAMIAFYLASQQRFTTDQQMHYIYSPRELTRWCRGIFEAIRPLDDLSTEGLVRIWAHEGLRLFQDRLLTDEERGWTDAKLDLLAREHFANLDFNQALSRPILYSNWMSRHFTPVDREELREFTKARLRTFHEEELDVPLVLFDDVLEHVLRIDRVFRQTQGHLLLIGVSGAGKVSHA